MTMAEKTYTVIREGVSQRDGDGFIERKVGEEISLSPAAAEHLLAEGYVEDGKPAARKATKGSEAPQ